MWGMKRKPRTLPAEPLAVAACAFVGSEARLAPAERIQLFPAGEFRAIDGRPADVAAWRMDADIAARLVAAADARSTPYVLDYDHASLTAASTGARAPAAAWFKRLEWVDGVGLFAVGVEWTAAAAEMVAAGEYRFTSPVFIYDPATGAVVALINAGLTNNPALDGLADVAQVVAASLLSPAAQPTQEDTQVEELIEQLRWLLNLPVGATAEDIKAQLQKLMDQLGANPTAAASFDLAGHVAALAHRAAQPDPAAFVPIAAHKEVADQLAALSHQVQADKVGALVTAALSDARLLPAQEIWARELGMADIQKLEGFLATAQPVVALSQMQTHATSPAAAVKPGGDPAADLATAALSYQAEQAGKGVTLTTAQAVRHVEATRSK